MSEYQYYEFQAVDRPLGEADRQALRDISSRARITSTSFTNSYDWGDLKGDPVDFMKRWFDLHLYLANWNSRRLMIRLPARLVSDQALRHVLCDVDCAHLTSHGDDLLLDIMRHEIESDSDWDDGSAWLAELAPLRSDILAGDLRLLYLLWLTEVEGDALGDDAVEPLTGIAPLSGALQAFVRFFALDPDLVAAAAEHGTAAVETTPQEARTIIAAMADHDRIDLLDRLHGGDPHVAIELRALVRERRLPPADAGPKPRTAGELRSRAQAIRDERSRAVAEKAAAARRQQAEEAEQVRAWRMRAIAQRGDAIWNDLETEIETRTAAAYARAVEMLADLQALAEQQGEEDDFAARLTAIRERHARKGSFLRRIDESL